MLSITDLPVELITCIADDIYPGTAVSFACACRLLHSCIAARLRECRRKSGVLYTLHDREPMRIVKLLRELMRDPDLGYYVRKFEIWAKRDKPAHWKWEALKFERPDWIDSDSDPSGYDYHHDESEGEYTNRGEDGQGEDKTANLDRISGDVGAGRTGNSRHAIRHTTLAKTYMGARDKLEELLGDQGDCRPHCEPRYNYTDLVHHSRHVEDEDITEFRNHIQHNLSFLTTRADTLIAKLLKGNDEALKLVLLAHCPQLRSIVFVNLGQDDEEDESEISSYGLLDETIQGLFITYGHSQPWPCFYNVREVVTGVDYHRRLLLDEYYHPHWEEVASLLLLPRIDKITFDTVSHDVEHRLSLGTYKWRWEGAKSSVKHLVFTGDCNSDTNTLDSLLRAIDCLKTIDGFNWKASKDHYIRALATHQAHSLKYLELVSMGLKKVTVEGLKMLKGFEELDEICFAITDFVEQSSDHKNYNNLGVQWTWDGQVPFIRAQFKDILPQGAKAIRIAGDVTRPNPSQCEDFIKSLEGLVTAKSQGLFKHLSHICLWRVLTYLHHNRPYGHEWG